MRFRDIKEGKWYRTDIEGSIHIAKAVRETLWGGELKWRMKSGVSDYDYILVSTGTGVSPATEEEVKAFKKDLLKQYKAKIDAL